MRARALRPQPPAEAAASSEPGAGLPRHPSVAALVFLRGRDADARLRELAAARTAARPLLGALACELVERRLFEPLGYRCLGDWSREKLGVGARSVREWARVWRRLRELPRLREAVLAGEVSWTVARLVAGRVTPETEAACLETVRGRTVRAVEALLSAVEAAEEPEGARGSAPEAVAVALEEGEQVFVRLACSAREAGLWHAALELARRMAGEPLPAWACAEAMAAEGASAWGVGEAADRLLAASEAVPPKRRAREANEAKSQESGLRAEAWRRLSWKPVPRRALPAEITSLAEDLEPCSAREIDARFRAALAWLQQIDFETGRILRQVVDRGLYRELDFESLDRYVTERLDLSPRTARRLVALARAEHRAPAVATAFRTGRVTALQALALAKVAHAGNAATPATYSTASTPSGPSTAATLSTASTPSDPSSPPPPSPPSTSEDWVAHAERVTLRRLEQDVDAPPRAVIAFHAPREVAALFLAVLARAGSLEALLAHAIASWTEAGSRFRDYADLIPATQS
jgi:hypothetical protein